MARVNYSGEKRRKELEKQKKKEEKQRKLANQAAGTQEDAADGETVEGEEATTAAEPDENT